VLFAAFVQAEGLINDKHFDAMAIIVMLVYIPLLISALSSENILNGSSLSSLGATGDGMVSNDDIEVARSEEASVASSSSSEQGNTSQPR
jgi:hypothetical protein